MLEFQNIAENIKKNYRASLINKTSTVLFENKLKNENKYFGRDEYFNSIIVDYKDNLTGKIRDVKILKANSNTLFGEIIPDLKKTNHAA